MKKISIPIAARCTMQTRDLTLAVIRAIVAAFTYRNTQHDKLARMGYPTHGEPKNICTAWQHPKHGLLQVPRGGAQRLRKLLAQHGYEVEWVDKRLSLPLVKFPGTLKLRENQSPAAHALFKRQQGLLRGETGSGKTETLLAAAIMAKQPTLIIVWNKGLQRQWIERILKYGIERRGRIGGLGGVYQGRPKHGAIAVAMQQSLVKYAKDWKMRYGTVILDEAHRAPADTYAKVIHQFPAKNRWGATADEKRQDKKEFITYDCFGPVTANIASAGTVLSPYVTIINTAYTDRKYEEDRQHTDLITRLTIDKVRNKLIRMVLRYRLKAGRRILLFTERVDIALWWVSVVADMGYTSGPLIGGVENQEWVTDTMDGLRTGTCQFAACTSFADVGLDIPVMDSAFITCPIAGHIKRMNQQVGRVVRPSPGKADAEVYYFADVNVEGLDRRVSKIKTKWKTHRVVKREHYARALGDLKELQAAIELVGWADGGQRRSGATAATPSASSGRTVSRHGGIEGSV